LQKAVAIGRTPQMAETERLRHSFLVRVTHWLITLAFLALLVSGLELVVSHPRFYWGEVGNTDSGFQKYGSYRVRLRSSG
jgi:hypothetical protein